MSERDARTSREALPMPLVVLLVALGASTALRLGARGDIRAGVLVLVAAALGAALGARSCPSLTARVLAAGLVVLAAVVAGLIWPGVEQVAAAAAAGLTTGMVLARPRSPRPRRGSGARR